MDLPLSSIHYSTVDMPMNAGIFSESRVSESYTNNIFTFFLPVTGICEHTQYRIAGNSEGVNTVLKKNVISEENNNGT